MDCPAVAPQTSRCFYPDPRHPERAQPVDPAVEEPDLAASAIHGALRAFILDPAYPCVGAKSAIQNGSYRLGLYETLGSPESAAALARDLAAFVADPPSIDAPFATFIAVFESPLALDPPQFEALLWAALQSLHDTDAASWAPDVASDPEDPHFSFSFAGAPFFVVGLHPGSERLSRRFPWPALVFNPHAQFEKLRAEGRYERMQEVIRQRDVALQGNVNPVLRDHGEESEARQYSGRNTDPDWAAPFEPAQSGCPFGHGVDAPNTPEEE
jgi:FPC/CPF motif-containing protein YcgG